jgi:plastocyanin
MRMSVRFLVSAFIFTATACGSSTGTNYGGGSTPPASCAGTGASATIDATGSFTFNPNAATITAGQKVCWVNNSGIPHTVSSGTAQTAPSDDGRFTGGQLQTGTTVVVTFAAAGSYPFHCNVHLPPTYNMTGTITVNP